MYMLYIIDFAVRHEIVVNKLGKPSNAMRNNFSNTLKAKGGRGKEDQVSPPSAGV